MKGGGPQGDSDPVRAAGDRCSPPDVPSPSSPELQPCQGPAQVDAGMDEPCPWVVGHGASLLPGDLRLTSWDQREDPNFIIFFHFWT